MRSQTSALLLERSDLSTAAQAAYRSLVDDPDLPAYFVRGTRRPHAAGRALLALLVQVLVGLALFLTFFVMGPTIDKVYAEAYQPFAENRIAFNEALARGEKPMREWMLKQTRQSDLALFAKLAKVDASVKSADLPFKVLVPAFVTSELKTAFTIGFMLFLPFLVIDLVVSSVLMSLGMMMMSPMIVSLPFKLLLFVVVDGWTRLIQGLVLSYA